MAVAMRRIGGAFLIGCFYLAAIELQFACMDIAFEPKFHTTNVPDRPVTNYIGGTIGIVESRYLHMYLYWAYRHLAGIGYRSPIQDDQRLGTNSETQQQATQIRNPVEAWEAARRAVDPTAAREYWDRYASVSGYGGKDSESWDLFENCPEDAWRTAVATLESRAKQFGKGSAEVKEWLSGQEIVFSNCQGAAGVPGPVPPRLHPLISKDREYQTAAARFYAGDYDEAVRRFEAIGRDVDSPWQPWGLYLSARCFIRRGILTGEPNQAQRPNLAEARRRLLTVIAEPDLRAVNRPARRLLDYVLLRLESETTMSNLSARLLKPQPDSDLNQNWIDYDWLLDRGVRSKSPDDLADWILTFRDGSPAAFEHALQRWRQARSSPWLIAALAKVEPTHHAAEELIQAAAAVDSTSPSYVMASYHRFRLQAGMGFENEARAGLDAILWERNITMPPSARNHLLALRQRLAVDFDSFLRAAPRQRVEGAWGGNRELSVLLDADSLVALNEQLPLRRLLEAAHSDLLDAAIRKEVALAAWARAAIIEDSFETELRQLVRSHWPELSTGLGELGAVSGRDDRRFALALLILRNPGIRPYIGVTTKREDPVAEIDALRENWWCSFGGNAPMHTVNFERRLTDYFKISTEFGLQRHAPPNKLRFLNEEEQLEAEDQLARLKKISAAPSFLGEMVTEFARVHPADPRVPEALHLVVRATRVGCTDDENAGHSRAAFQFLHRNYPRSEWAAKTKYWYR